MDKKIISYYWGGLGNQLFIYFTTKAISIKNNCSITSDITYYRNDIYKRSFELNKLGIHLKRCDKIDSFDLPLGVLLRKISNRLGFHLLRPRLKYFQESNHSIDLSKSYKNSYLFGYWQDYKIFDKYKKQIINDINFSLVSENQKIIDYLNFIKETSEDRRVFLGIRSFQETKTASSSENIVFYKSAILFFENKIVNPKFFVFSNNTESVKILNELKIDYTIVPSFSSTNSTIEHLYLGTFFENYILTNSTFYWWMNYLSVYEKTSVYASTKWSNKNTININWTLHK